MFIQFDIYLIDEVFFFFGVFFYGVLLFITIVPFHGFGTTHIISAIRDDKEAKRALNGARYLAVSLATSDRGMAPDPRLIALARVHGVCFPHSGPLLLPNPAR